MRHLTSTTSRSINLLLLLAFLFTVPALAAAQTTTNQLASLGVEIWPDYDRPSALVLLTGTLPANAPLPATLTIPLPAGAEIHAVASFNQQDALMMDVDYSVENNQMTLTTPSNRFRVEYYAPYVADGDDHVYTFDWTSDLNIDQVTVVVQQPAAATDFSTDPAAVSSAAERGDGLTYHTLPARPVGAGEPFTVRVVYTVAESALSAPPQTAASGTTASDVATTAPPGRRLRPPLSAHRRGRAGARGRRLVPGAAASRVRLARPQAAAHPPGEEQANHAPGRQTHANQRRALLPQLWPTRPPGRHLLPPLRDTIKEWGLRIKHGMDTDETDSTDKKPVVPLESVPYPR